MNRKQELLDLLQEEASEVIQAVSKLRRFPQNSDKRMKDLYLEIGDFCGIMKMLIDEGFLDPASIQVAAEDKIIRVEPFMKHKKRT